MSIQGSLEDFSLPEIFQFLQTGQRTGVLTVRMLPASLKTPPSVYYIWVYEGNIVAAANRLDQQGLVSLIEESQLVSDRVFDKLVHWCCQIDEPLGVCLQKQGVVQAKQLKRLFQIQVLQPIYALFQIKNGQFKFDQNASMPTREMTGLSIPAGALNQYHLIQRLVEKVDDNCMNVKVMPTYAC